MRLLSYHASFTHRNFNVFFLQWVGYRDVKSGRRETSVVLLYRDVAGLPFRACDLILLLYHHR